MRRSAGIDRAVSRRRVVVAVTMFASIGSVRGVRAQAVGRVARIGFLYRNGEADARPFLDAFRSSLARLGWDDGRNARIEIRYDGADPRRIATQAAELVAWAPDVLIAMSNDQVRALQKASRSIPIVMVHAVDPVGSGLIESLARPGGNTTGLSAHASPEVRGKRLELLAEMVPGLRRVAVLRDASGVSAATNSAIEVAAARLGLSLEVHEIRVPADHDVVFAALRRQRPDGLLLDGTSGFLLQRIADFALANRLPSIFAVPSAARSGMMASYGPDGIEFFRRAADYVDRILRGTKPADLPVEQPMRYGLVINLRTARAIGVTVPQSVLARADEVIE